MQKLFAHYILKQSAYYLGTKTVHQFLKNDYHIHIFLHSHQKLVIDEKAIDAINYVCQGDLRKAVNILQATASLDTKINEEAVYNVSSRARPEQVKEMILLALQGKFLDARNKLDELMYEYGMSGEDIVKQLFRETMSLNEKELDEKKKVDLVDTIGEYDFRIVEGANERIQLEALLAQYMKFK